MKRWHTLVIATAMAMMIGSSAMAGPAVTAFTYQGQLKQGGNNVNASADVRFILYDALVGGAQVGPLQELFAVPVSDGLFTVELDFGAGAFGVNARWLEIHVRVPAGGGNYAILSPRQAVRPAPLAQFALGVDGPTITDLNASNLASGTVADVLLSGNVGMLNATQTFTGANTFSAAPSFNASGGGSPFSVTSTTLVTNLNADRLDGLNSTAFLQSIPVPLTLSGSTSEIIRGENTSTGFLPIAVYGLCTGATGGSTGVRGESASTSGIGVYGQATAATGTTYGGQFRSNSASGNGVFGIAAASTGDTNGVSGQSISTAGRGVFGSATAATGTTYGGYFESASPNGRAVNGLATAASGTTYGGRFVSDSTAGLGVFGYATATTGVNYGVYGQSNSNFGIGVYGTGGDKGVYGEADDGVFGVSFSSTGRGVVGWATAASGINYGGWFESDSTTGRGIFSIANAATGTNYGGRFQSQSTSGRGIFGEATASSGTIYGVYGQANTIAAGYAVFANGDMGASGVKPFRIDHPDDPANKYLLHYAAESPEVINFYRGTVVLDGAGEAVVALPHYFGKINKTPSYQLTAVGAAMPNLHIAEEIDEAALSAGAKAGPGEAAQACWFRIAGGAASAKVSWEVKAVRNDRWVQQRGAPVEVEKQDLERGTYQHPEHYGQPKEMGMDHDAEFERQAVSDAAPR